MTAALHSERCAAAILDALGSQPAGVGMSLTELAAHIGEDAHPTNLGFRLLRADGQVRLERVGRSRQYIVQLGGDAQPAPVSFWAFAREMGFGRYEVAFR